MKGKTMRKYFLLLCAIFCIFNANQSFGYPTGKLTLKVIDDEAGNPIRGAMVHVSFMQANDSGIGLKTIRNNDVTNAEGFVSFQGVGMESVGATISKDGYYQSGSGFKFTSSSNVTNRWEPWNPTVEVVLKKKRNPVPMYVKGTDNLKLPQFDIPIGYDLEKGDLVVPYGTGTTSDFIFSMHSAERAYTDYECNFSLTFSNEFDGIQEYFFDSNNQSNYKWPFLAPESGYVTTLFKEKSMQPGKGYTSNEIENVHYIFRVRTKTDNDGKIVSALYGKIVKEFEFDPKGAIFFGYYLNPDGTRNLEEDPKRNLFKEKMKRGQIFILDTSRSGG